jgi:hypothetical protein
MTDEASAHLRNALLSVAVLAAVLCAGYVLLSVYKIGFAIVGVFPVALVSSLWGLANASLYVSERVGKARRWAFLAEQFWLVLLVAGPILGGLSVLAMPNWDSAVLASVEATLGVGFGSFGHNGTLITAIAVALSAVFRSYGAALATLLIGPPADSDGTDTIAHSVAELKRQHEAGEIDEAEYERKLELIVELGQEADRNTPAGSARNDADVDVTTGDAGETAADQ